MQTIIEDRCAQGHTRIWHTPRLSSCPCGYWLDSEQQEPIPDANGIITHLLWWQQSISSIRPEFHYIALMASTEYKQVRKVATIEDALWSLHLALFAFLRQDKRSPRKRLQTSVGEILYLLSQVVQHEGQAAHR